MRKSMKQKKLNVSMFVVVIIGIYFLSIVNYGGIFEFQENSDYNTGIEPSTINYCDTERFWQDCWQGQAQPGTGYPFKEMMPDTKYVTSFSSATGDDALSERINIIANIYEDDLYEACHPIKMYYRVGIKTDPYQADWTTIIDLNWYDSSKVEVVGGTGWKTTNFDGWGLYGQIARTDPIEIRLKGSIVGAMKVDAIWRFSNYISEWNKKMSTDYAYLISGNGQINIEGYSPIDVPMFEIGDTVPIYVSADYSGATGNGSGRWQLWAFPLRGGEGRMLKQWDYDYFREPYDWVLPPDAWVRGSSDSRWQLELYNTLFATSAVMINTIDIKANAPPTPTIVTLPTVPQVGDTIDVEISANTNANTHEKITKFIVMGTYLDNYYKFVHKDVQVDFGSEDPFTASTTIYPPRAGEFRLQVWAHDEAGRQSEVPGEITIEMHEGDYRITITIVDEFNSIPIDDVRVECVGGSVKYSDSNGVVWFDLDAGSREFLFSKAGFRAISRSWTIVDSDLNVEARMERTTNTWDVTVTVLDGKSSEPVWGATVQIGGTEKMTDQHGIVPFDDVQEGEYIITAKKGTKTGEEKVNIDRMKDITIKIYEPGEAPGEMTIDLYLIIFGVIVTVIGIAYGILYARKKGFIKFGKGKKKKK